MSCVSPGSHPSACYFHEFCLDLNGLVQSRTLQSFLGHFVALLVLRGFLNVVTINIDRAPNFQYDHIHFAFILIRWTFAFIFHTSKYFTT